MSNYTEMDETTLNSGDPVKVSTVKQIITNQKDIENRIRNVEAGGGKVYLFNKVYDLTSSRVGDVITTVLDENDAIGLHGDDYAKMIGQDMTGKDLASKLSTTTAPNSKGRFLRDYDNGDGDNPDMTPVRGTQEDQNASHTHTLSAGATNPVGVGGGGSGYEIGDNLSVTSGANSLLTNSYNGGNEARGKSFIVNHMVKLNDLDFDYFDITRAFSNLRIVSATVSVLNAGDSGSISLDILKGSDLSAPVTMLNTALTLDSADGYSFI